MKDKSARAALVSGCARSGKKQNAVARTLAASRRFMRGVACTPYIASMPQSSDRRSSCDPIGFLVCQKRSRGRNDGFFLPYAFEDRAIAVRIFEHERRALVEAELFHATVSSTQLLGDGG